MQWSKLTKKVEDRLLADSMKKRVGFYSASYPDEQNRQWITFDGVEFLSMNSWMEYIHKGQAETDLTPYEQLFEQGRIRHALHEWLNLSIENSLTSENVLIRSLSYWDRRLGKRKLKTLNTEGLHPLESIMYYYRCECDELPLPDIDLKSDLKFLEHDSGRSERKKQRREHSDNLAQRLTASKTTFDLKALVRAIFRGSDPKDLDSDLAGFVAEAFQSTSDRDLLLGSFEQVARVSKLLDSDSYFLGLLKILGDQPNQFRPTKEWTASSHNVEKQFSSFACHHWAKYSVPKFLDKTWLANDGYETIFKGLGAGKNIRKFNEILPVPLSKKEGHHFLKAPDEYNVPGACRWAQIHAMEGDERIANGILESRLAREFTNDKFWKSVIQFFIDNPMLDTLHFNPIIDFIWHHKFEPQVIFIEAGVAEERPPLHPNFSMAGRNVDTLLTRIEKWHERLGRDSQNASLTWKKSDIGNWSFTEGDKESKNMKIWRITELLSNKQLAAEGRAMVHCVASYAQSCHAQTTSIWSLTCQSGGDVERIITVELSLQAKTIVQARGKRNRKATEEEKAILKRWCEQNDLKLMDYV